MRLDELGAALWQKIGKGQKWAFISCVLVGYLVHLYAFTNIIPNGDGLSRVYDLQQMTVSGRWFLHYATALNNFTQMPAVIGALSLLLLGLAAALKDACENMAKNAEKVTAMRDKLIAGLSQIPHSALNGDPVNRLPGNVSFCFEGIEGESLLLLLDAKGVCASSGSACTSGSLDPSHVLLAIGRVHDVAHGSLRLSVCHYNTDQEVEHILKVVPEVVGYLRSISPVWRDLQNGVRKYIL